jgi:hypothetical protein
LVGLAVVLTFTSAACIQAVACGGHESLPPLALRVEVEGDGSTNQGRRPLFIISGAFFISGIASDLFLKELM